MRLALNGLNGAKQYTKCSPTRERTVLAAFHFNRQRSSAFVRFLWQRFFDDRCLETAGALSYTTLFAAVPLTAAVFGVIAALPVFAKFNDAISNFVFNNFVPATGQAVQHYLLQFASNASKLTGLGVVVLLFTALMLMGNIEERFNRIWRVTGRRAAWARFLVYWAALTLGPVALVAGLALTTYLSSLPGLSYAANYGPFKHVLITLLPFLISFGALLALYRLVPNRRVKWKHASIGALLAAVLFQIAKLAFTAYVTGAASYQQIYGAIAVVPIFLIWVFVSWVIVLLGATMAASLAAFEYRPNYYRLPPGAEFLGLMHLIKHFAAAQRAGRAMDESSLRKCERFVSDELLQRYLDDMQKAKLIQRTDDEAWVLVRSLDAASLADLYEVGHYRLPLDPDALENLCADLPQPLRKLLGEIATHLRATLDASLEDVFQSRKHLAKQRQSTEGNA